MAIQKPKMYYKVYKQSARVGGKFYGVPDQSDPIVPTITMQQIIDFKKLHNYSASQLATLVEEVLSGGAELVSIDGQSRNLSSLIKFEPVIKGTFVNEEAGITDQKILVRPRILKDIKVQIDRSAFEFVNEAESTDPRLRSVAIQNGLFVDWKAALFQNGAPLSGPLTFAGDRLSPISAWGEGYSYTAEIYVSMLGGEPVHMEVTQVNGNDVGVFFYEAESISENAAVIPRAIEPSATYWRYTNAAHTAKEVVSDQLPVRPGDKLVFTFTRPRTDEPTQLVSSVKEYTLV